MVMNRSALKWKLVTWLACTSVGAAAGLVTIGLNYLLEITMGFRRVPGENWVIFLGFQLLGVIAGLVGAVKMRPRVWS